MPANSAGAASLKDLQINMSRTLSPPRIDGFEDVESFAAEHGLANALVVAHEILFELYMTAHRISVEHYIDPEDEHESLFFVVAGDALPIDQEVELQHQWNQRICQALSPDELFRIGMYRDYTE